jgi:hypothetical protein
MAAPRRTVNVCVDALVFGNVAYWFLPDELTIPDDTAEAFLVSHQAKSVHLTCFGDNDLLFSREAVSLLTDAGFVRCVPI